MTLVEVLIAVFLLSLLGTVIVGVIVSALRLTRTTTEGVFSQGQLNDAVSRITRDIAASDPILATSTGTSPAWLKNTPAADDLWLQSVQNGKCVRTRYYVNGTGAAASLNSDTQRYSTGECPDPRLPDTSTPSRTTTIIRNLKTTNDAGA